MTDTEDGATSEGPNPAETKPETAEAKPDRFAKARAVKKARKEASAQADSRDELFEAMRKQIESLQSTVLRMGNERAEKQEATLDPIPAASADLPPGTYIQVGVDAAGAPIMGKVRWTRDIIERTYIPVTFTPLRSMDIGPHGIHYHVDGGVEVTVPKIVKDLYDEVIKGEAIERARYRPIGAQEAFELASRASETPGRHWSRPYRAGYGLDVRGPEPEGTPEGTPQA